MTVPSGRTVGTALGRGTGTARSVRYGPAALDALDALLEELRNGDPLSPVTVVVPSALAGLSIRRALTRRHGGLAGVAFSSLPALAGLLAAPRLAAAGRRPLDRLSAQVTVARLLRDHGVGHAWHSATVDAYLDTFTELYPLDADQLATLAARGPARARLVEVFGAYREAISGRSTDQDAFVTALDVVQGAEPGDGVGARPAPVVVYLPRRLAPAEMALLGAMGEAVRVLVGVTGRPEADTASGALLDGLAEAGLTILEPLGETGTTPVLDSVELVRAPDAAEETRHAVRLVGEALDRGVAPERIAVVARVASPYLLLAHEELTLAGVDHHAPAPLRLSQSVAGRTLLGLLDWVPEGATRAGLIGLLGGARVLDPLRGGSVPAHRWDRRAREAGVIGGLDQWRQRLELRAETLNEQASRLGISAESAARDAQDAADIARLLAFVEDLAAQTTPPETVTWAVMAAWAKSLLVRYLGTDAANARLVEGEQRARAAVFDVLDRLGNLDGLAAAPDRASFHALLTSQLEVPGGRAGRFGKGVTVARLVDLVGADLDLVVVLGGAEGLLPPGPGIDPLLPAADREAVPGLRPRGASRAEEERDLFAVLAGAGQAALTVPAADPRRQRALHPAPWLLEIASARAGRPVRSEDLGSVDAHGSLVEPWFCNLHSFEHALGSLEVRDGALVASGAEADVREVLRAHRNGADPAGLAWAPAAGVSAALRTTRARLGPSFDEWNGNVGHHAMLIGGSDHRSATSLERYAGCPARYFFEKVLGVGELDDPAHLDTIEPRERGTLVHEILEEFVSTRLNRAPIDAWTDADRTHLDEIANRHATALVDAGRTGRSVLWQAEWRTLLRHLHAVLGATMAEGPFSDLHPVQVEYRFGDDDADAPAVEIDLGVLGPVRFRGTIDRIDLAPDGSRLRITDYKTGKADDYKNVKADLVDRGRHLQLALYAEAALPLAPQARVEAYYWFIDPNYAFAQIGREVGDAERQRLREVLEIIVGGIQDGYFPARPGERTWLPWTGDTWDTCARCPYDRVCPTSRGDNWQSVKVDERLARLVDLMEGELAPAMEGDES